VDLGDSGGKDDDSDEVDGGDCGSADGAHHIRTEAMQQIPSSTTPNSSEIVIYPAQSRS
jgi:hypothetical protein